MAISRREIVVGGAAAGFVGITPQVRAAPAARSEWPRQTDLDWQPGHRIEIAKIGQNGAEQRCPHCQKSILTILNNDIALERDPPPAHWEWGSDVIPIYPDLDPSRREGFGWETRLAAGRCGHCGKGIFKIMMQFGDAEPNHQIEELWWYLPWWDAPRDRGDRNFVGLRGDQSWFISRGDTPVGPMLTHHFGFYPYDAEAESWFTQGLNGREYLIGARTGRPWEFARQFVLTRFDELRALPCALGLDASDERAKSRSRAPRVTIDRGEAMQHANQARNIEMMAILDRAQELYALGRIGEAISLCCHVRRQTRVLSGQRVRAELYYRAWSNEYDEARDAARQYFRVSKVSRGESCAPHSF